MTEIRALAAADHDAWLSLWRGYLEFYQATVPDEQTDLTWNRLLDPQFPVWGAMARVPSTAEGRTIGFVHWLTHPATWSAGTYCYLEDLFVAPDTRGAGAGRALIAHVEDWARAHGSAKVYWLTHETNSTARALYDRVATHTGFVHYEMGLDR
ncbi:GNAT family N-acetyltransferase [Microbacterium sp. CPCC 204701]|uniref:GNAT family N-acetyltransferase n=1 Tax=Microbacterium sp. CPCC 204701 TaxID=2493084 RepID=UPI000FD7BFFF|nr:GNAT family N-acetyltransferase [Microbacterium sp. CPCC 204701]